MEKIHDGIEILDEKGLAEIQGGICGCSINCGLAKSYGLTGGCCECGCCGPSGTVDNAYANYDLDVYLPYG